MKTYGGARYGYAKGMSWGREIGRRKRKFLSF